jgi:hypothetical protein
VTPQEYCYDYLVGAENRMVYFPVTNYVHGDLEVVRELIELIDECMEYEEVVVNETEVA